MKERTGEGEFVGEPRMVEEKMAEGWKESECRKRKSGGNRFERCGRQGTAIERG